MTHINIIKAILCASIATTAANAQQKENVATKEFNPHAYIQIQGGEQYTLAEANFNDLISPNIQVAGGYRLKPWLGIRLSVGAWQSKGGFNGYRRNGMPGNVTYKYNYVAPAADITLDLSNIIYGYNPNRTLSVSAFIGAGANIGFSNNEANDINSQGYKMAYIWDGTKVRATARGGIGLDFRVSDAISLGMEANANILNDHYNSKKAGNADWYFNLLAGIKVNIGKTTRKTAPTPPPTIVTEHNEPEVKEERPIQETPAPVEETKKETEMHRDIFFKINSSEINGEGEKKIAELAEFLKENKDATLYVTGYADAKTGNDAINNRLSRQRAEAVKNVLTGKHKIEGNRIKSRHEGSRIQPFAENDMNRVSICITRR